MARLIKYHISLFALLSTFVLLSFYIADGGDLGTPSGLVIFYSILSILAYLPLLLSITLLNLVVVACGFSVFKHYRHRLLISLLPIAIFSVWFLASDHHAFYKIDHMRFLLITGTWLMLTLGGMITYSGMKRYAPILALPLLIFSVWYLFQRYGFEPYRLSLKDQQFKIVITVWALLNSGLFIHFRRTGIREQSLEINGKN